MTSKNLKRLAPAMVVGAAISTIVVFSCDDQRPVDDQVDTDGAYTTSPTVQLTPQQEKEEQAWNLFLNICQPSGGGAIPSGQYRAEWQDFGMNYDIYLLPDGDLPVAWDAWSDRANQRVARWTDCCPDSVNNMMAMNAVLDEFIEASNDPAPHHPLIDRNSEYVRTGVYYNEPLYNWVIDHKLYDSNALQAIIDGDSIQPFREDVSVTGDTTTIRYRLTAPNGSMTLKTSWKLLGPGDDPTKFHTTTANLVFENYNTTSVDPVTQCSTAVMGLVGMHMTWKNEDNPYWVWATFEHKMNAPDSTNVNQNAHYNFYDQAAVAADPPFVNRYSDPTDSTAQQGGVPTRQPYWYNPGPGQRANQIARILPRTQFLNNLNTTYQDSMQGTVWENYMLMGVQWSIEGNDFTPEMLANSTLESYEQFAASCMGCHTQVSGLGNDQTQYDMGNVLDLYAKQRIDVTNGHTYVHNLYTDFMWSTLKFDISGHLTWKQIKLEQQ